MQQPRDRVIQTLTPIERKQQAAADRRDEAAPSANDLETKCRFEQRPQFVHAEVVVPDDVVLFTVVAVLASASAGGAREAGERAVENATGRWTGRARQTVPAAGTVITNGAPGLSTRQTSREHSRPQ